TSFTTTSASYCMHSASRTSRGITYTWPYSSPQPRRRGQTRLNYVKVRTGMSDQSNHDLYSQLVQQWTERDEIELERRSTGWYNDLAEFLCWQRSLSDWPPAIEGAGEIDSDELSRTIAECALLAVEEGRRARYALLTFVGQEVHRTPPF